MINLRSRQILSALIGGLILFLVSGCGGLAGEPRIVRTSAIPTITPTSPPDLGRPAEKVNLVRGAEIFGGPQGCAECHGIAGKGDGPVAPNFTCILPDFTDIEASRSKTILAWFAITSNGNGAQQSCLMPPWKGRLSEQQRWDVSSYIYSLHYSAEQLAQGQKIFQDKCAACHGATGSGDGPDAKSSPRPVPNFTDPAYLISLSDTDLWNTVTNGLGPVMPAFKDQLSDSDRWAVVAYTRSLTWDGVGASPASPESANATNTSQVATQSATAAAAIPPAAIDTPTVAISGKIVNLTTNQPLPAGQAVTLRVLDDSTKPPTVVQSLEAKITDDGTFTFGDVPRNLNKVYVVTTTYAGFLQVSTPIRLVSGAGPAVDLSFNVYETISDPAVVSIEIARIFASPFSQNTLLVRQGMRFQNNGNAVYLNENGSVVITLPANAQQITLEPTTADQFTITGTTIRSSQPLYPGPDNAIPVQVSYLLPYQSQAQLSFTLPYAVASVSVYTPEVSGFAIAENAFVPGQSMQLQDGIYKTFDLQGSIPAATPFTITFKGQQDQASDRRTTLAVVLFLAGLVLVGMGFAIWRLNQNKTLTASTGPADQLIAQIAALDTRFEQGQLEHADYEAERTRLKAEAAKRLEQ